MAKVQKKLPVEVVVIGAGLVAVMGRVPNEMVMALLAVKPLPVTVTASPAPPVLGLITILGLT